MQPEFLPALQLASDTIMKSCITEGLVFKVPFDEMLEKSFVHPNGFKNTVQCYYPNIEEPIYVGLYYAYDSCWRKFIG